MYAFTVSTETLPMVAMNFPLVQREGRRFFIAGNSVRMMWLERRFREPTKSLIPMRGSTHLVAVALLDGRGPLLEGLRDLGEDLLKARVDAVHEHLPAILRAEDDMVAAAVYDMFTVMVLGFR